MEMTPSNSFEAEDPAYPYFRSIVDTLNSVTIPGSFASGGPFQFSAPALKINGVEGYVGVPVCDCQAKAIIAVCSQAPFGRGQETIVDTTVRNTWELDPSQFTISNPQWNSQLENLAAVVKKELGCDPKLSVKCDLYKFLLYEQGSFFKVHTIMCFGGRRKIDHKRGLNQNTSTRPGMARMVPGKSLFASVKLMSGILCIGFESSSGMLHVQVKIVGVQNIFSEPPSWNALH